MTIGHADADQAGARPYPDFLNSTEKYAIFRHQSSAEALK